MSYEEEFARMEAQLDAEENGVAPVAVPVAVPEELVKLDTSRNQYFMIDDVSNIKVNLTHGVNSLGGCPLGIRSIKELVESPGGLILKCQDQDSNVFSAYVINQNPTLDRYAKFTVVFFRDQPKGVFIPLSGYDLTYSDASDAINSFKLEESRIKAEAIEKLRAEQRKKKEEAFKGARDKWTALLNPIIGEEFWEINSRNELVMLFPEIEMSNGTDNTHIIRDLYVTWPLTSNLAPSGNLCGFRGLKTIKEHESGYNHSHLSTGSNRGWSNTFCLGSGRFGSLINGLNADRDLDWDLIQEALLMISLYVSWESIDGGPYMRYSTVKRHSSTGSNRRSLITEQTLKIIYNQWMGSMNRQQIAKIVERDGIKLFTADVEQVNTGLVDAVTNVLSSDYIDVVSADGKHTPLYVAVASTNDRDTRLIRDYNIELSDIPVKEFKGKTVVPKIWVPSSDIDESNIEDYKKVPMKIITKYVIDKFENDLNMHVINTVL